MLYALCVCHEIECTFLALFSTIDFTQWRELNSFESLAYDFRYILSNVGYMSEYSVNLSFTWYV